VLGKATTAADIHRILHEFLLEGRRFDDVEDDGRGLPPGSDATTDASADVTTDATPGGWTEDESPASRVA
jgi:hypothetical protein